jgi:hypothetical protein
MDEFFSFHACQGMLDLCKFALDSIAIGNGDVVHHGCTLSAWVCSKPNSHQFFK